MLNTCVIPRLNETGYPSFFQQDGAPPHFAISTRNWLDAHFPERWIGRAGPINWPARSPDLTMLDFSIWGHLKHEIYKNKINGIEHLMERIVDECNKISPEMLVNCYKNFDKRVNLCLYQNGGLFEHLIK